MNAMQHAFAAKGMRPPALIYRAWRILKDNPGPMTAKRVTQLIGDKPEKDVAGAMSNLLMRGMVRKSKVTVRGPIGQAKTWKDRPINTYELTLPNAKYELLPAQKAPAKQVERVQAQVLTLPSFVEIEVPQPEDTASPPHAIDNMTVATARDMYRAIRANFNTSTWD